MTDLPDELRAVLSSPDDDAPRLAYADALDARSDGDDAVRARFIRLQLRLAKLGSMDADADPEAPEATDLRGTHGDAWAAPVLAHAQRVGFDRGFVEHVYCAASDFVTHGTDWLSRVPLRHLTVTTLDTSLDVLLAATAIVQLRSLSLDGLGLTDAMLERLASASSLASLRWLSIAKNRVTQRGGEALAASTTLPSLAYVRFFGNDFDPTEHQGHDQGVVVDRWLPQQGRDLEAKFGPLRWLHVEARTLADVVPDRYRIA